MFCPNCGNKVNEGNKFCTVCGHKLESNVDKKEDKPVNNSPKESEVKNNNLTKENNVSNKSVKGTTTNNNDNIKIYKILAYIGWLFIIGMLVNEKDNKSLKFHVGQGMLVFILEIIVVIINKCIVIRIFGRQISLFGYGTGIYETTAISNIISTILYLVVLVFSIIGIVNAYKDEDKELPLIGSLAFYK